MSGRTRSVQDAPTINDHDCNGRKTVQAHTAPHPTGNWVVYGAFTLFVEVVIIGVARAGNGSCCVKWLELIRIMWRILCTRILFPRFKPGHKAVQLGGADIAADYLPVTDNQVHYYIIKRVPAVVRVIAYSICILHGIFTFVQR